MNMEFVDAYSDFARGFREKNQELKSAFLQKFGERIKELRMKRGFWNTVQLADASGVDAVFIENMESGIAIALPKAQILWKLAYALNCPAKQILQYADFELLEELWPNR